MAHIFSNTLATHEPWPVFLGRQVREIHAFRYVLRNLIVSEIRHRYRGSVYGFVWALLSPLLFLVVVSLFFALVLHNDLITYSGFVFSGKIPWIFVQTVMLGSPVVFRSAEGYLKRLYVPKVAFPLARVCVELVNFLLVFTAFYALQLAVGLKLTWPVLLLPLAVAVLAVFLLGLSLLISIGSVYFHDLHHIMHVLDNVLIYSMPMIYHIESIPEQYHIVFELHPFYQFLRLFRAIIYEGRAPYTSEWLSTCLIALITLVLGLVLLKRCENDIVYRL